MVDIDARLEGIRETINSHEDAREHAHDRFPADAYREALTEMDRLGEEEDVGELVTWIEGIVEKADEPPQPQAVRSEGRDVLDRRGREVPEDSWFAADDGRGSAGTVDR